MPDIADLPRSSRIDWDDLRHVWALAEGRSLSQAAALLGVRHTTVLRRVAALEQRLGARLFDRSRHGYTPTEAGELMAEQARRMQPAVLELERRILGRDLQLTGTVRFNTSYITMLYLLPEPLAAFARSHPGIEVEVIEAMALVDLSRRDADVALRISKQVPQHLVGRRVGDVRMRVYARRGAVGLPQSIEPLPALVGQVPWIGFQDDRSATFFERWMRAHVPPQQVRLRVDLFHSMAVMLRTGLGVGLLPTFVGEAEPELVAVSDELEDIRTPMWLLTHPDLRHAARVRTFMQEVGEAVAGRLAG